MKLKKIAASLIVSGAVLSSPLIVNAQTTTTPVDQLEDEMAKLTLVLFRGLLKKSINL